MAGVKRLAARALNQLGIEHSRPLPRSDLATGRAPDFVGIGVQRCGTSWMFELVTAQPGVHGPLVARTHSVKELHWFDRSERLRRGGYDQFFPYPEGELCGEWTPSYGHSEASLEALAQLPETVTFLVMLRDPWQRFGSGLRHEASQHLSLTSRLVRDANQRSLYGTLWRRLCRHIPAERIEVVQFERAVAEAAPTLTSLLDRLGHRAPVTVPNVDLNAAAGTTAADPGRFGDGVALRRQMHEDLRSAPDLVARLDLALWPSLSG